MGKPLSEVGCRLYFCIYVRGMDGWQERLVGGLSFLSFLSFVLSSKVLFLFLFFI